VGPGLGVLTGHLLQAGANVVAIELDRDLVPYLRRTFDDLGTLTVIEADALNVRIDEILPPDVPYTVVANLPYSIASAVLMHFLEQTRPPSSMTVMVQREVADRLVARPPEMTVLGVAAQVLSAPERAFLVAPESFLPPPRVESAVLTLRPLGESLLAAERRPLFFQLVNGGFRHKRKQVLNSLAFELDLPKEEIAARLTRAGVDPMRRAQTLSVDEWLTVLDAWEAAA
jgi:16S rRNA (adenine1518-N6/adenine1519-N6)-dimethyltransferase